MLNAQHLKMVQSLTLTKAYIQLKLLQLLIAVLLFCSEKAKMVEPYEETCYYGPGLRFVSILHKNSTVSDQDESNSCRVSDQHEVRAVCVHF